MLFRPRSIRGKLLAVFVAAAVIPMGVLGVIFYISATHAVDEMVGNRTSRIAQSVRRELDRRLELRSQDRLLVANEPVQAFLESEARLPEERSPAPLRALRAYLGDLFAEYGEYFDEIILANPQGRPLLRQDRLAGSYVPGEAAPVMLAPPPGEPGAPTGPGGLPFPGMLPGRTPGFREADRALLAEGPALAEGAVRFRTDHPIESGRTMRVNMLMPVESIRQPGARLGYVLGRIRAEHLWPEEWTTRRFGERGQLVVVDAESGEVLYHTRHEWIGRPLEQVDPALRRHMTAARPAGPDSVWSALGRGGGRRVATVLGLSAAPWKVIATAAPAEFASEARRAGLWNLIIAAVALLVAALLLVFFSGRVSRSIQTLTAGAQRISGGDLLGPPIRVETHDEVETLADAFNHMTASVRRNIEMREQAATELDALNRSLETRVRERTQELESLNAALNHANEELKELDRLKSNFLATVSHEFKTPLTSIKAFAEILHDELEERNVSAELRRFLRIIDAESDRLSRLIKNVLDLSRIESGRMVWRMTDFPAAQVVESTLDGLLPVLQEKRIRLERDLACGDVRLHGDPDRIQEVLANVLDNAVKASTEGQRIVVGCAPTASENGTPMLRLFVRDEGCGIPADELERIFDRFHQVGPGTRRGGGTGLGLAISREITEHHGGRIWAESAPGRGSIFHITLPIAASLPPGARPGEPAATEGRAAEDPPHV